MAKPGKRMQKVWADLDRSVALSVKEAVAVIKARAIAKFDETIEVVMNLNVDPRKSDQNLRGMVSLPHGTGKTIRVAVFARGVKAEEAQKAGADLVGAEDLVDLIEGGEINFDRCIATPDMMVSVGKLGKILGTRGLMPNPKLGTVTMEIAHAVQAAKSGQVEYRTEKAGIVHAGIGKASFSEKALQENIKAFTDVVTKVRPSSVKGVFVKAIYLSSTMGPSVPVVLRES